MDQPAADPYSTHDSMAIRDRDREMEHFGRCLERSRTNKLGKVGHPLSTFFTLVPLRSMFDRKVTGESGGLICTSNGTNEGWRTVQVQDITIEDHRWKGRGAYKNYDIISGSGAHEGSGNIGCCTAEWTATCPRCNHFRRHVCEHLWTLRLTNFSLYT